MSAICGIFRFGGQPMNCPMLSPVMDALAFYGPDGAATSADGPVMLGHQMLHVTPESLDEKLPWKDDHARQTITADARIDNRDELFETLAIPRPLRSKIPDSQLILRAFQKWGPDCPRHMVGDYAFAVWDAERQELFCARDHIGVRPFYYFAGPGVFIFASDIRGVLAHPQVPQDLDESYVASWLRAGTRFVHLERTFYREVRKLPPAHTLQISGHGLATAQSYWNARNVPLVGLSSDDEYAECLAALLRRAVADRMRCAFPVGAHLSGGLDSSAIAVLAARGQRQSGRQLDGYSWSPPPETRDQSLDDERAWVQLVAALEDIRLHYWRPQPEDRSQFVRRDVSREPVETLSSEIYVSRCAALHGNRVLLSGWGGDEVASSTGRGYLAELFSQGRWATLCRELKMFSDIHSANPLGVFKAQVILPLLRAMHDWREPVGSWGPLPPCLKADFASHLEKVKPIPKRRLRVVPGVMANQLAMLANGHLTHRIEHWAASGAGDRIVYAYPLLDRRILEFCLGVPADQFFKNGWERNLFRRALEGILPADVQWQKSKLRETAVAAAREATCQAARPIADAWFTRRENDPAWGYCVDLRQVRQLRQSIDQEISRIDDADGRMGKIRRWLTLRRSANARLRWSHSVDLEIVYHNLHQRTSASQSQHDREIQSRDKETVP